MPCQTKEWIFYTDGDAQYDPRQLTVLVEGVREDVDMVNGYKIKRRDPLHRVWIGLAYQYFVKLVFGLVIRDVDCDFRLMRRSIFDSVQLESRSGTITFEMVKKIQDAGIQDRRSPGASLLPPVRSVAVLQSSPCGADAAGPDTLVVAARGPKRTPAGTDYALKAPDRVDDRSHLFHRHVRSDGQAE